MVCEFKMQDGTTTRKTIDVKYVPNLSHNLFSITEELSKGAKLSSNSKLDIRLAYPNGSILSFDRRIRTRTGWVPCIKFVPLQDVAYLHQRSSYVPLFQKNPKMSYFFSIYTILFCHSKFKDQTGPILSLIHIYF